MVLTMLLGGIVAAFFWLVLEIADRRAPDRYDEHYEQAQRNRRSTRTW